MLFPNIDVGLCNEHISIVSPGSIGAVEILPFIALLYSYVPGSVLSSAGSVINHGSASSFHALFESRINGSSPRSLYG